MKQTEKTNITGSNRKDINHEGNHLVMLQATVSPSNKQHQKAKVRGRIAPTTFRWKTSTSISRQQIQRRYLCWQR